MCHNNNSFKLNNKSNRMKKLLTQEKCFKINGIEYHLRLIPTKYFNSNKKTPSSFTQFKLFVTEAYSFSKTKGRIKYSKKKGGEVLQDWRRGGRFSEEWYNGLDESWHYLTIKLKKERLKKTILINEVISDSVGRIELKKVLIKKVGIKNKHYSLETII